MDSLIVCHLAVFFLYIKMCTCHCDARCTGDGCGAGLTDNEECQAKCIGTNCTATCTGIKCRAGCTGSYCSSHCTGLSCEAWCVGTGCKFTMNLW